MRVFVAIDIPDEARDALERLQDDLPVGRLMAPETFHLTLAFLDEQPAATVEAVHEALGTIQASEFELTLRGVDVFGGGQPKVLWCGAEPSQPLADLRHRVRQAAMSAGIALHRERFRPHVTLARFNGRLRGDEAEKLARFLARNAGFKLPGFAVTRFSLFQSVLHPDGAAHEVLADYPLV